MDEKTIDRILDIPLKHLYQDLLQIDPVAWMMERWSIRGHRFSFKEHWYQAEILEDDHPYIVIMKGAQMGVSEIELAHSIHFAENKGNVIYLFPTSQHIGEFVQARLDPVVEENPYLTALVRPEKEEGRKKNADRVSLKRVGRHFIFLRGSNTTAQLKSIDGDKLVIDEFDEMKMENVPLAKARVDHSLHKVIHCLSTPTIPGFGIHEEFLQGDQRFYHIKCDACGEWQRLTWQDNINPEISMDHRICRKCQRPIDHAKKGEFVATHPDKTDVRSYHISQLYSGRVSTRYLLKFALNPKNEQELFNSKLGEPYSPRGGKLNRDEVLACVGDYEIQSTGRRCTMGVDVGRFLHFQVSAWQDDNKRVLLAGTCRSFEELDVLMKKFDVSACVIDANPETRLAREFAFRFRGRVWIAYYPEIKEHYRIEDGEHGEQRVLINRTMSLDYSLNRFRIRGVVIPGKNGITSLPDTKDDSYVDQLCAPTRVEIADKHGNMVARYVEGSAADHYAHANNYDEIAGEIMKNKGSGWFGGRVVGVPAASKLPSW